MRSLLAVAVTLALAPHSVDAKCAMWGIAPSVLATTSVVVVGYQNVEHGKTESGDVAVQADWRFRDGGTLVTPVIETVAPGLAVYKLPASAKGTVTLQDARKKTISTLLATGKPAGLAAPRAKKVVLDQRLGRRPYVRVTVELDGKVPDRAVALVLADATGKPMSWGRVTGGSTAVRVVDDARCRTLPNKTTFPEANQKVTLFWVDDTGTKSPAGRTEITAGTTAEDD